MISELAAALLVPGWAMRVRRRRVAAVVAVVGVAFPLSFGLVTVLSRRNWVALSIDTGWLAWLMTVIAAALVARLIAVVELWDVRGRPRRPAGTHEWLAVGAVIVLLVPLLVGIVQIGRARASVAPAFAAGTSQTLFDADTGDTGADGVASPTATTTTTPDDRADGVVSGAPVFDIADAVPEIGATTTTIRPKPARPRSGIDPARMSDVRTILLLGGDAGPGRSGLRTDTMMLFSIHEPSGRASLVSIPRDMTGLLFPPGSALETRFPFGFTELTNAVYPYVGARADLRDAYRLDGVSPGVVALAHGVGYSLDVTIDDYVLVDMHGFLELIDAVGGVTVDVPKEVPMPGNVPGAKHQYPDTIGPGTIHMDGTTALGYVRSRYGDNDYYRTGRQRALLAALATQVAPEDVLLEFDDISTAVGAALRTSLTPDELAETLSVIGGETAIVESVGLVPPLVDVKSPDFQLLAEVVGDERLSLVTGQPSGW